MNTTKPKRGRPRKSIDDRKSVRIAVRVTLGGYEHLRKVSAENGTSISAEAWNYIRMSINHEKAVDTLIAKS